MRTMHQVLEGMMPTWKMLTLHRTMSFCKVVHKGAGQPQEINCASACEETTTNISFHFLRFLE